MPEGLEFLPLWSLRRLGHHPRRRRQRGEPGVSPAYALPTAGGADDARTDGPRSLARSLSLALSLTSGPSSSSRSEAPARNTSSRAAAAMVAAAAIPPQPHFRQLSGSGGRVPKHNLRSQIVSFGARERSQIAEPKRWAPVSPAVRLRSLRSSAKAKVSVSSAVPAPEPSRPEREPYDRKRDRTGSYDPGAKLAQLGLLARGGRRRGRFRKRCSPVSPAPSPGSYIRTTRHFRPLFHWRPTRRRVCRRHGERGLRAGIRRHRGRGGQGFPSGLPGCRGPRARSSPWGDGARPPPRRGTA